MASEIGSDSPNINLEALRGSVSGLAKDIVSKNSKVTEVVTKLMEKVHTLSETNKGLTDQLSGKNAEIINLKNSNTEKDKQIVQLQSENSQQKTEILQLKETAKKAEKEMEALKRALGSLAQQLDQAKAAPRDTDEILNAAEKIS